jgi:hypothetical protein
MTGELIPLPVRRLIRAGPGEPGADSRKYQQFETDLLFL